MFKQFRFLRHAIPAILALTLSLSSIHAYGQTGSSSSSSGGPLCSGSGYATGNDVCGPTAPISGYLDCGAKGGLCTFSGSTTVVLGGCYTFYSNGTKSTRCGSSAPKQFTGSVLCDPANFEQYTGSYAPQYDHCYYKPNNSSSSSSSGSSGGYRVVVGRAEAYWSNANDYELCAKNGETCSISRPNTSVFMAGCAMVTIYGGIGPGSSTTLRQCTRTQPVSFSANFKCADELFPSRDQYFINYGCYVRDVVNLALSATASASSQSGNSRTPAMTNDGKADTRWEASNSTKGSWLRLTLANPVSVQQVVLKEFGSKVKAFRIEYLSGSQWITAANGNDIGSQKVISFTPVSTGSVRIVFTDLSGQPSISEFEVY